MKRLVKIAAAAAGVASLASPTARGWGDGDDFVGPRPGLRIVLGAGSVRLVAPESRVRRGLARLPRGECPSPLVADGLPRSGPESFKTAVRIDPEARGEDLRFQEHFAAALARSDPRPPQRTAHFDWLPHFDEIPTVYHAGWDGTIVQVEPQGDGSRLVKVRMTPALSSMALKTLMFDYVEETYRVKGDAIELVGSDAETPRPRHQTFPVMF
ncbi:hypothetical protein [Paludisphaera mucosa]|uniref:Uncharacterized protein n=1 Tax=Paludisphaera mucosa TaxID=3030827 RepID=A0ABT6FBM4_9BACT|nr:hypothetical protein [Paludisphaera mucosa]MDG3005003.1 hypothetical protein [Paludisphaera mucosa]